MVLSRKDVERARNTINTSLTPTELRDRVSADLDVVKDAYDLAAIALTELSKAFSRIDSVASQEGSGAAVKAFRDIASAQKDIASTLIALRAEGRTTIRETLAAAPAAPEASPPPSPAAVADGIVPHPAQEFLPSREVIRNSNSEFPIHDLGTVNQKSPSVIVYNNAPAANIPANDEYSSLSTKIGAAPVGAAPSLSPLDEFLKAKANSLK